MKPNPELTFDPLSDLSRVLVTTEQIQARVDELARQISRDYAGDKSLLLVGILRGAFIFLADLTRRLTVPHIVDFMALSSYDKSTTNGEVRVLMDLRDPVKGRDILIVEDIIDSGRTLDYLSRILLARRPASLQTCVMARKRRVNVDRPIRYVGFEVPDVWAVGYGLDYAELYRTLPYIAELALTEVRASGSSSQLTEGQEAKRKSTVAARIVGGLGSGSKSHPPTREEP